MQLFSLRDLGQPSDFVLERPLIEIDLELQSLGALDIISFSSIDSFSQLQAASSVVDKHSDVCCCVGCGNTFDPLTDAIFIDPSEIQSNIPADITTTAVLQVGVPLAEIIDTAGDRDWFSVTLEAGQTYTISVIGQLQGVTPPVTNTFVALYDENGSLISSDDSAGFHESLFDYDDGLLTFTAGTTGTYFVEADAIGVGTGSYIVSVETRADDAVLNGPASQTVHEIGSQTTGSIDYNADQDWYAVDLVAGETYEFILDIEGVQNTLPDAFLSFHDANGLQLAFDDDGGAGLGSRIVFTAETSGTYFVSAQGFTGNSSPSTGNYTLRSGFAEPLTPLDAIDWGTSLSLSGNTVTVYFANAGETFGGETSVGWLDYERDAAMAALNDISNYLDLNFVITNNSANADFQLVTIADGDFLGSFGPPGTVGAGVGTFVRSGTGWSEAGLQKGGFGYVTLIHEFGHGLGLAHPHDAGGESVILSGVSSSSDRGIFDLNQGVFTTMSYVDGWAASPYGTSTNSAHGWQGTLMALDLAVLQAKYGAVERNTGDTVYTLPDSNTSGSYWEAIWDTGGTDTLQYNGTLDAVLDLREATLQTEEGGGGFLSYAFGIFGGFTIAAGAVIENALGSSGNDTLIGNAGDNLLEGLGGADAYDGGDGFDTVSYLASATLIELNLETGAGTGDAAGDTFANIESILGSNFDDIITGDAGDNSISGGGGADTLNGGAGNDTLVGGAQNDIINGGDGDDLILGELGVDILNGGAGNDKVLGGNRDDQLYGGDGDDKLFAGNGFDYVEGGDGQEIIRGGDQDDLLFGGNDDDTMFGGTGRDTIHGEEGNDLIFARGGFDIVFGGNGDDVIDGGLQADTIDGGAGADTIIGGSGLDTVSFQTASSGVALSLLTGGTLGDAAGDTYSGIENVTGSNFNDTISATDETNTIRAGDGDDVVNALGGNDSLFGENGNDTLNGGLGNDNLFGDVGNDTLNGDDGNDLVDGGDGIDTLNGGAGLDTINGGDGNDILNGGADGDLLTGGDGADILTGGSGVDAFVFNVGESRVGSSDTITDLEAGELIVINTHIFIGTGAFTGIGNLEARYTSGATTLIEIDRDGDGLADEAISIAGDFSFTSDGEQLTAALNIPPFDDGLAV